MHSDESGIRPGIRRLFRLGARRTAAQELDDEIRLHIQLRAQQLVAEGMAPDTARAEAERRFGPMDEARGRLHRSAQQRDRRLGVRDGTVHLIRDARIALRALRRSPAFVVTAVLCIALGVGANAAAYSVFEELLVRPLPVHEPARLVNLAGPGPHSANTQCNQSGDCEEVFSHPMYRDLARENGGAFSGVAAHRLILANLSYDGRARDADGVLVSGNYFSLLGLRPALGRLLGPDDDREVGGHPVVVVSYDYWATQLGADPAAIGRPLVVNGRPLEVVGVAPDGFHGTTLGVRPSVFVPLRMASEAFPFFGPPAELDNRQRYWLFLFARLAPGMTMERAATACTASFRRVLASIDAPLQQGLSAATLERFRQRALVLTDGRRGQSLLRAATRTPLAFLLGITALVVLIACANVANLLLVRGSARATEIAVRMSLGASRRQLVAMLLTEAAVLAALGGLASLVVARGTLVLIRSFIPPSGLGTGTSLALEMRPSVLAFAGLVAMGTGLLFGLFPALHGTRPDLVTSIRAGAGQIVGGHRAAARFRAALVVAQIALSLAMLGAAGLFIRSLRNVGRADLGVNASGVVAFGLLPALSGYDGARAKVLLERVERALAEEPGVVAVGTSSTPLFFGGSSGGNVRVEGFERGPDTDANVRVNDVSPGFFRALGIPLRVGREFDETDRLGGPKVVIVNEAFVRKFNLPPNPLGRRMALDHLNRFGALDLEIVGVVPDASYATVKGGAPPTFFMANRQLPDAGGLAFYVRSRDAAAMQRRIPAIVTSFDAALPVSELKPLPQQIRENVFLDRMIGTLSAAFAVLATLLAAVGLYGVLAYTVAQRSREFGVRMALGASAGRVRGMVLGQVARLALIGGAIGIAAALGLGGAVRTLLYGVDSHDPVVLAGAALVLGAAALLAAWVPAWRASRLSPSVALRGE